MKLIIDINENLYKVVQNEVKGKVNISNVWTAIANGIPYEERPTINCKDCDGYEAGYSAGLKDAERPQGRWIPVSERLPNIDDYTGSEVWQKKVLITGYLSFDDTKNLFVSEAFAKDIICNRVHNTIVIAWQPLPEPYKEGG